MKTIRTMHHGLWEIQKQPPEVFLGKGVLKICSKLTREHPCRSAISINLLCNFIEIALWHGCSRVNLLHISRPPFLKNTSRWLLLEIGKLSKITLKMYTIMNAMQMKLTSLQDLRPPSITYCLYEKVNTWCINMQWKIGLSFSGTIM